MEEITPKEKIKPIDQKGISNELVSELFNPTFDLSIDYSEIYIDDLIENETLKEIPIIKSIVGIVRTGIAINQFWFAKKLLTFISSFNDGSINQKKLERFRTKVQSDEKFTK
ncbi:hypothetical protein [Lentimicrobium sp. S6]|nr:hypothetical protein [Lentimicrobium sp. S6]NPD47224.1 hypothetical protein [Lentimicrobium sp. S6]